MVVKEKIQSTPAELLLQDLNQRIEQQIKKQACVAGIRDHLGHCYNLFTKLSDTFSYESAYKPNKLYITQSDVKASNTFLADMKNLENNTPDKIMEYSLKALRNPLQSDSLRLVLTEFVLSHHIEKTTINNAVPKQQTHSPQQKSAKFFTQVELNKSKASCKQMKSEPTYTLVTDAMDPKVLNAKRITELRSKSRVGNGQIMAYSSPISRPVGVIEALIKKLSFIYGVEKPVQTATNQARGLILPYSSLRP
jgi:hypothetical protein